MQPSLDARDELERIDVKSIAALTVRDNADEVSHDWTLKIAGAVRSDPNFGEKQPALRGAGLRDEERPRERFDPRLDRTTGPDPQGCHVTSNLHPNTGRIRQRGSCCRRGLRCVCAMWRCWLN